MIGSIMFFWIIEEKNSKSKNREKGLDFFGFFLVFVEFCFEEVFDFEVFDLDLGFVVEVFCSYVFKGEEDFVVVDEYWEFEFVKGFEFEFVFFGVFYDFWVFKFFEEGFVYDDFGFGVVVDGFNEVVFEVYGDVIVVGEEDFFFDFFEYFFGFEGGVFYVFDNLDFFNVVFWNFGFDEWFYEFDEFFFGFFFGFEFFFNVFLLFFDEFFEDVFWVYWFVFVDFVWLVDGEFFFF